MLTHAVGAHWHAVVRDVLALGYRAKDIFTTLDLEEMLAIVVAAPPTSSLRHSIDGGWSREAHLLANLNEQRAGIAGLNEPYARPGIEDRQPDPNRASASVLKADVMTWAEMDELDRQRESRATGKATVRVW